MLAPGLSSRSVSSPRAGRLAFGPPEQSDRNAGICARVEQEANVIGKNAVGAMHRRLRAFDQGLAAGDVFKDLMMPHPRSDATRRYVFILPVCVAAMAMLSEPSCPDERQSGGGNMTRVTAMPPLTMDFAR
nr:hypothetical protein [Gammaproteobacteria bacterium]